LHLATSRSSFTQNRKKKIMAQMMTNFTAADMPGANVKKAPKPAPRVQAPKPAPVVEAPVVIVEETLEVAVEDAPVAE
jgi:hypothetical protein